VIYQGIPTYITQEDLEKLGPLTKQEASSQEAEQEVESGENPEQEVESSENPNKKWKAARTLNNRKLRPPGAAIIK